MYIGRDTIICSHTKNNYAHECVAVYTYVIIKRLSLKKIEPVGESPLKMKNKEDKARIVLLKDMDVLCRLESIDARNEWSGRRTPQSSYWKGRDLKSPRCPRFIAESPRR